MAVIVSEVIGHKMHNVGFIAVKVVYKGLVCIKESRVPHSVSVPLVPMS